MVGVCHHKRLPEDAALQKLGAGSDEW